MSPKHGFHLRMLLLSVGPWLVYELFRGSITDKQLEWSEAQIREFVASRKTANPHLCAAVGIAKGGDMPRGGSCDGTGRADF